MSVKVEFKAEFKMDSTQAKLLQGRLEQDLLRRIFKGTESLYKTAKDIMDESLMEVPRKTGTLASSNYIEKEKGKVVFGYGGPNDKYNEQRGQWASEYMLPVHEILHANHEIGKAKFLEDPIVRNIDNMRKNLINDLKAGD